LAKTRGLFGENLKKGNMRWIIPTIFIFLICATPVFAEKAIINYHTPGAEKIISWAFRHADIRVPIFKIGVGDEDGFRMAIVQFGVGAKLSKSELARNVMEMIGIAFAHDPKLERIDIYGSDRPDRGMDKGKVLFSVSAKREDFQRVRPEHSSINSLKKFGLVYFSDSIKDPDTNWIKLLKKHKWMNYYILKWMNEKRRKQKALEKLKKKRMMEKLKKKKTK